MEKHLDSCFDRVEKALANLIDSITKYNPSSGPVNELGAADAALNKGLEQLQKHQANYRRIEELRAATVQFDTRIKDTLRLLANTRKELKSTPATAFPDGPNYEINYDELLNYARRISKTTRPPAGAVNAPPQADSQLKVENGTAETAATTPAGGTPNGTQPQPENVALANGVQQSFDASQQTTTSGGTNLPDHLTAHLNPHSGFEFVPWPREEQVRKGAIASLAYLAEQGVNAENYDPEEEKARKEREEEERRQQEEKERLERDEKERRWREEQSRMRAERERNREREEAERRASMNLGGPTASGNPPSASPVTEKKQFQFMMDDDDDDDD
ncbi:hypothetical protein F4778DRAFT_776685 [Xylariomycetidae sp. FL2044]|nr:hypothetical protein F4778DRAFT_776685 [Xylariomycetidae sp. FL2044]